MGGRRWFRRGVLPGRGVVLVVGQAAAHLLELSSIRTGFATWAFIPAARHFLFVEQGVGGEGDDRHVEIGGDLPQAPGGGA